MVPIAYGVLKYCGYFSLVDQLDSSDPALCDFKIVDILNSKLKERSKGHDLNYMNYSKNKERDWRELLKQETPYNLLAAEYYDASHLTCRNFDAATKFAVTNHKPIIPDQGLVLEVGCGKGRCNEFLGIEGNRIIQLDSSYEMLALENREPCLLKVYANAVAVPFFDGQFSLVAGFLIDAFIGLCFFSEVYRLLSPNGMLVLTTPAAEWGKSFRGDKEPAASTARFITRDRKTLEVPSTLVTREEIREKLLHTGFKDIRITSWNLPCGTAPISPDIQAAAEKKNIGVDELPIIYLIEATKIAS